MKKNDQTGVCKLTGGNGKFVKSHIIPRALTRLGEPGAKFLQAGIGRRITQPSESWYDGALATEEGEAILSDIDSKAIEELRKHRMVWSGWNNDAALHDHEIDLLAQSDDAVGIRTVHTEDPSILQVFFLSLLWRAAASSREEFTEIELDPETLEDLRLRVLNQDPGSYADFPVVLTQISTRGPAMNRTPLLESGSPDGCFDPLEQSPHYARFYFDGLVARVFLLRGRQASPEFFLTCWGLNHPSLVGTISYENSRQLRDLRDLIQTVNLEQKAVNEPLREVASAVRRTWTDEPDITHQLIPGWIHAVRRPPMNGRPTLIPYLRPEPKFVLPWEE